MKLIKHIKDYWFAYIFSILLITIIIYEFNKISDNTNAKLIRLEEENKMIQKRNNILLSEIDSINKANKILDASMEIIIAKDSILRHDIDSLNNKINKIRSLYEKAKSRPDNFNSDSLLWYFSNI